jgi:5-methyltetrahydrofolate--homocysteine methyltransferase
MDTKLKDHLAQGKLLIADGATGTMMMAAGLPAGAAPELWNVEQPDRVLALYNAYLEAGSQIILTNTFGGSRPKLAKTGLAERTYELNLAAARLARQAANGKAYVAGDIGPTGELMAPMGPLSEELALEVFSEQASALAEGGVDAIWIETMSDLVEARAAVTAARQVADLPVFCSLSFGRKARTMMGVTPKQAALELWPLGLSAIGANCGEGLDMIPEVLAQMRQVLPEATLIAKPNAGLPKLVDGQTVYEMDPAEFALRMADFVNLGAQIVGSCCGSSPAFISALAERVG